jgi:hypothetical protein
MARGLCRLTSRTGCRLLGDGVTINDFIVDRVEPLRELTAVQSTRSAVLARCGAP